MRVLLEAEFSAGSFQVKRMDIILINTLRKVFQQGILYLVNFSLRNEVR